IIFFMQTYMLNNHYFHLFIASLIFFLFLCYAVPRLLHSFPTRRSSDLGSGTGLGGIAPAAKRSLMPTAFLASPRYGPPSALKVKDRKSTRLNSSHVAISYAVFCLKKKKNLINTRREDKEGDARKDPTGH